MENSAYPLTTCAERCVIVKAVSEGDKVFKAIAVSTYVMSILSPSYFTQLHASHTFTLHTPSRFTHPYTHVHRDIPDKFAPPCGACRQVMAEFGVDYWVILTKPDKTTCVHRVSDLLPHSFTTDDLRAGQSTQ